MRTDLGAIKRLTRNDVSWILPQSKSHQAGINLPLRSFKTMFTQLIQNKDETAPRKTFDIKWFSADGVLLAENKSQVVRYHSKNELRLVNIPKNRLAQYLQEPNYLFLRRDSNILHITIFDVDPSHLILEVERALAPEK
jgi:hypothetical protein